MSFKFKKVQVSGAKNSATRLLAASLIADEVCTLYNFPTMIVDANVKKSFIEKVGGIVNFDNGKEIATINPLGIKNHILRDYNYPIRTTYLLAPGLLKKTGVARIPYPGGCNLGVRGYDLHVMVWKKMGAKVIEKDNHIEIRSNGLKGADIEFPITTIGGTETALICGAIADGTTRIKNAYISPEVFDLIEFLKKMGVDIDLAGNSKITINGKKYHQGTTFSIIPDRIEALTWIIFSAISEIPILIENVPLSDMQIPLIHLKNAGIDFFSNGSSVLVSKESIAEGIQPFELATGTHPGVISDMQPFFVLLGMRANGISRIFDYRYPNRIAYLDELSKFVESGLTWKEGKIKTIGPIEFRPATANSTDLRGSMAVLMSALVAKGEGHSTVNNVGMALRGYNKLEEKLKNLGFEFKIENNTLKH